MASQRKVGDNKLNNLKEYWTVPEAAQYLSDICGVEIGEADVLRLVLKGKLKLSVNILKNMAAKYCPNTGADASGRQEEQPANFLTTFIKKQKDEGKICYIEGIYDLLMIGGGILDVEYAFQKLDGGPASKRISSRGTYVEGADGQVYQLQEYVKDENPELFNNQNALPEFPPPPKATMSFDPPESHEQPESADSPQSLKDIPRPKLRSTPDIFRPAGCLPKESKFLVHISALRELVRVTVEESGKEKQPSPREEKSNLHIIGALLYIIMTNKSFSCEEDLREYVADKYKGFPGCAARTLAGRFSEAKKLLDK